MFICLLLENFFATTFLNSLLHVGPGTMGSCGQLPTKREDGVQSLQLCSKIPSLQVLEELLLPRSVNPGLQLQTAAYSGHEVSSHCEGCLSAQ